MPSIDPMFSHQQLNAEGRAKYETLGVAFTALLQVLRDTRGDAGPEGTLAIRSLQVARMWAAKAVSVDPSNQEKCDV